MSEIHILGIRHHGPGSARSVIKALETIQPDCVLVEGPPEADEVLPLLIHAEMQPPIALLIYAPDDPQKAGYYPFARFSPEYQALSYSLKHNIPARFMDLPMAYQFALDQEMDEPIAIINDETRLDEVRADPLGALAKAAGYPDGERWWEHMVEQRLDSTDLFAAILEAMSALRDADTRPLEKREALREATMRNSIRAAQKQGCQKIAVICGAWHAPALVNLPAAAPDNALLKGLKKIKTQATWIPWTYSRLSMQSGYGAGVQSPGWYHHLWEDHNDVSISWLTKVSHLLREADLDASTAQIIDAVRMVEALAAMRDRPIPGLEELNEATRAIFCFGYDEPMKLIAQKLIIGERMGEVPDETPSVPIQQDLQREQKRLRMRPDAGVSDLNLDLREENHREKSQLLHRLRLLGVGWGKEMKSSGSKGTFKELWRLQWHPEFTITLIERSIFGNRVDDAAAAYARHRADTTGELPQISSLVNIVLLADLPEALDHVIRRLQEAAAVTDDVKSLMGSVPSLVDVLTYGSVRRVDAGMIQAVIEGMLARIWIGLPGACVLLDDDAADAMFKIIIEFHNAVRLLQKPEYVEAWYGVLHQLVERDTVHGLIAGRCCRILLDNQRLSLDETARLMRMALNTVREPAQVAAWIDGFLRDSGLILLHDVTLLQILDQWVVSLDGTNFMAMLPLLRRTFSTFHEPERRQIGENIRGKKTYPVEKENSEIDPVRAKAVLPVIAQLLGLKEPV